MMDWFKDLPLVFETPHWLWLLVIAPVLLVLRGQSGRTSSVCIHPRAWYWEFPVRSIGAGEVFPGYYI